MWSVVEKTALAEAEIEYIEKKSTAVYVKFPIIQGIENSSIIIWTTTPWTIPCNKAVAFSDSLNYQLIQIEENIEQFNLIKSERIIIAENLLLDFCKKHSLKNYKIIKTIETIDLNKIKCAHPLKEIGYDFTVNLFAAEHVTDETGTGFVHIAPNHGIEDFEVGKKNNLEITSTIDDGGLYTSNIPYFQGIHVYKADSLVVEELRKSVTLVSEYDYFHSYPHSWRSKAPLIYRATSQWFISLETKNLRKIALDEINKVNWIPSNSKKRITSMVNDRPDWCVSRQRSWGVPITIFISKKSGKPLISKSVNSKILKIIQSEGIDSWFKKPKKYFLEGTENSDDYDKVESILDVWFDSGASHVYVLKNRGIKDKADLYLEGSDQHRGWFQTSLIESCANYGESPFKTVLTHGFVIDDQGKKMSKSLGNVISPSDVIKKYGADILRLWVANSNYNDDVKISYENLNRQAESYRKIRNTIRFILGNLNNFSIEDSVEHNKMPSLEKFIRHKLYCLNHEVNKNYEDFNFYKAYQTILSFCSKELSSLFFDIRKDALYCNAPNSILSRSTKTVMIDVFECLIRWLSPIIPFTTEEAWQNWLDFNNKNKEKSCHLLKTLLISEEWKDHELEKKWCKILEIKNAFSFTVEKKRSLREIKSSLEVRADIFFKDSEYKKIAESFDLSEILISSKIKISDSYDENFIFNSDEKDIGIKIIKYESQKCPRCWKLFEKVNDQNDLCERCNSVINAKS